MRRLMRIGAIVHVALSTAATNGPAPTNTALQSARDDPGAPPPLPETRLPQPFLPGLALRFAL